MAEPLIELIAQAIRTRALSITAANGYTVTVAGVLRMIRRENETAVHMQIVLQQGERTPPEQPAQGLSSWVVAFMLHCLVRPGDKDATATDTYVNRFVANVEKAFAEGNVHPWWTAGVYDHYLRGPQALPDAPEFEGCAGATMIVEVHYRHQVGDPFTA